MGNDYINTTYENIQQGIANYCFQLREEALRRAEVLYSGNLSTGGINTLDSLSSYEMIIDAIFIQTFCDDSASQNVSTLWLDATAGGGSDIHITYIGNDADEFQQQEIVFPSGFKLTEDGDLKLTFTASGATDPLCEFMIFGTVS